MSKMARCRALTASLNCWMTRLWVASRIDLWKQMSASKGNAEAGEIHPA